MPEELLLWLETIDSQFRCYDHTLRFRYLIDIRLLIDLSAQGLARLTVLLLLMGIMTSCNVLSAREW